MVTSTGSMAPLLLALALASVANAACPYAGGSIQARDNPHLPRAEPSDSPNDATKKFLANYELNDEDSYLTSDAGGPIEDQQSLSAGERGPTLLEDFIFRQKIQHFDHERVPERAVHARGAGAHGTFTSYADWSNLTAASFLGEKDKETPMFVRFSTVAGSRGSADSVRDVHGFATRFYTDEGNFDIVGNNIPVFFIQDAIQFPDLIHSVKPEPASEIPQAASAHDTAWDFFSSQPSTLHTLFWAMAGNGIVRSYRHMDGFGVHTFRLVTDDGKSKLIKWHWKSLQGKASIVWEEAQILAGKNSDAHRQDLFESIQAGRYPEWELGVQIMEEEDELRFGFDVLDPTKIIPEELVPITPLGKMQLNLNPTNYFAETEQVMFQPGHLVRGVDFTDDPLLQGRIYSYLDTQLNRHGGPNFEQLPINQPRVPVHNNNRDGAGQMFIPLNPAAYSPNTLASGSNKQANQTQGRGFFTAPNRKASSGGDKLVRSRSKSFADVWSQPRLFLNSLLPVERQFIVNAMRFEISHLKSPVVIANVLLQLNRVSHEFAVSVARAVGVDAPAADPTFYHDNTTAGLSIFNDTLKRLDGLKVGVLTSVGTSSSSGGNSSVSDASLISSLSELLAKSNVDVVAVAESRAEGIDATYSAADASGFDAIVVAPAAASLMRSNASSTLFPTGRPARLVEDGYRYGKPIGFLGAARNEQGFTKEIVGEEGVFTMEGDNADGDGLTDFVKDLEGGLKKFRYVGRFEVDDN